MATWKRQFTQAAINCNKVLQNTAVYWEEEVWSYPTYAIRTSEEQVCLVHLRNQHWYLSNWDNEGTYFTLGLPLTDIDGYNGNTQGPATNEYKDVPTFTEYHTSLGSEEEDPTDEQIWRSPISISTAVQVISTAPHPTENISIMSITMAITTQKQSNIMAGGAGPSGGGIPRGSRNPPGGGGGGAPGGGSNQIAQPDGKPMGALPAIFEGDCSKAESFLWEFSTYLLVNHDVLALASYIQRIAIALTCIKGPEVSQWTQQQLNWLAMLQPADNNDATYQQFMQNFCNCFMDS